VADPRRVKRPAFSLVEMLVVVAIIAVVAGLLAVAIFNARGMADHVACSNNLRAIGLATQHYHVTNQHFPTESGDQPSFYRTLLPYLGATNASDVTPVKEYLCPGRRGVADVGARRDFGYAASTAYDATDVSILDAPGDGVSLADITRGPSNTFLLTTLWMDPKDYAGGDPTDRGWAAKINGRRHGGTAKPDGDATGSNQHLGAPYAKALPVLYADGHVDWLAYVKFAGQWSYRTTPPSPPTGANRVVVHITAPNNSFQVDFVAGPPGDPDEGR